MIFETPNHEKYIEKLIKDAQEAGKFNNLANEGQPIKVDAENPYIDEDWRAAFKVMENGGFTPPWIELNKEIDAEFIRTHNERVQHLSWLRNRLEEIKTGKIEYFIRDLRKLNQSHKFFLQSHSRKLEKLNQRIDQFNALCPVNNLLKMKIAVPELIQKYDQDCPAIPDL